MQIFKKGAANLHALADTVSVDYKSNWVKRSLNINTKYKHINHRKMYTIFLDIKTFNEKDFANHVFCFVTSHHFIFCRINISTSYSGSLFGAPALLSKEPEYEVVDIVDWTTVAIKTFRITNCALVLQPQLNHRYKWRHRKDLTQRAYQKRSPQWRGQDRAQVMLGCAKYIHQYFGINFH